MPAEPCTGHDCPPADDLDQLIHGRLGDPRASSVTEHVGHCTGCQQRMDALAAGDDPRLTDTLRQAHADRPPDDSALWQALSAVEADPNLVATALFRGNGTDGRHVSELKLDFLQPADGPDKLGKLGPFDVLRVVGRGG